VDGPFIRKCSVRSELHRDGFGGGKFYEDATLFDLTRITCDAFAGAVRAAAVAGVELPAVPGASHDAVDACSFG
jgi:hypothetical protein